MKKEVIILGVMLILTLVVVIPADKTLCFAEDSEVIVYGVEDVTFAEESAEGSEEVADPETLMAIEITGSRFGDSVSSEAVTISEERVIAYAETSTNQGITIIRVDINGNEHQVYCFDQPGQAAGRKLPAGSYKVYPDNLNRDFEIGKITAAISLELADKKEGEE